MLKVIKMDLFRMFKSKYTYIGLADVYKRQSRRRSRKTRDLSPGWKRI